ncbi:uncharacterized protein IL334_003495 [Kwoniella shivajii]|uniref:Methyltransferase type 11 domain-containing protein n=1 Tax=Kwoniella shivajii TaxID=564305 RepID=A0ABZ1CXQ1_9TREE|nr:hypothetical protein IL334_003495 [Kwoniella shivajii]
MDGNDRNKDADDIESRHSAEGTGCNHSAYFVENERSYLKSSLVYRFPVDHEEVIRQDRQQCIFSKSLSGLFRGPAVELAFGPLQWRNLAPLQHDTNRRNCTFMTVDASTGLHVFADGSFDVIHICQMLHALDSYPALIAHAHRLLRSGGMLLIHEPQLQLHSAYTSFNLVDLSPNLTRMMDYITTAFQYRGVDTDLFSMMDQIIVEAGFHSDLISTHYYYRSACPEDPESDLGQHEILNVISFAYATRYMILESGVTDEDDFDNLLSGLSDEVRGRSTGRAGPLGAQGVLSPWGYWWATKS